MWPNRLGFAVVENSAPTGKAPEFCAVSGENGAKLRSPSWWREVSTTIHRTSTQRVNVAAETSATAGIIFRNFLSGKRRN
jgi:hypothetical protein